MAKTRGTLVVLVGAAFVVFAQAFMIAPILPRLASVFGTGVGVIGLSVPAYLIPYGVATLAWGPIADRAGRRPVIIAALASFTVLAALTAATPTAGWFIGARVAAGLGASGIVPVSLMLVGDLFDYDRRGRAIGWLFGGMAGGMAAGSTVGAVAEPVAGWRGLFVTVAVAGAALTVVGAWMIPATARVNGRVSMLAVATGYVDLLRHARARHCYLYVGFNAVLQSGIYTWLGVYLHQRYGLGPVGIGLGLLGYGVPGFALGPLIGRAADRWGRARLIPAGLALTAATAATLALPGPLALAAVLITALSLGYDLTQPLLAGIATDLPASRGQAVAFMAVVLFTGFGTGSLVFQAALIAGFAAAFTIFAVMAAIAAIVAVPVFAAERPSARQPAGSGRRLRYRGSIQGSAEGTRRAR